MRAIPRRLLNVKPVLITSAAMVAAVILAPGVIACSVFYPIWAIRSNAADPLFRFITKEGTGYIDSSGSVAFEIKIPHNLKLTSVTNAGDEFHEGLLAVWNPMPGKLDYFLNRAGNKEFPQEFSSARDFSEGLAAVQPATNGTRNARGKWRFIDHTGTTVISPQFDGASNFSDGLALVRVGNRIGYIDSHGNMPIAATLASGSDFHEGVAAVVRNGACRVSNGGSCGRPQFTTAARPTNVSRDCKFEYVDKQGKSVFDAFFDDAGDFSEGLAAVRIQGKWGYINRRGKIAIEPEFDDADAFSEGFARVTNGRKSGFIDKVGKVVIPIDFPSVDSFSNGYALVWDLDQYYFIDRSGLPAFGRRWKAASSFFGGLAHVELSRHGTHAEMAYINTSGKAVFTYQQPY